MLRTACHSGGGIVVEALPYAHHASVEPVGLGSSLLVLLRPSLVAEE